MAGLLSGPVKELDETAEATVEATMEDADLYMCIYVHEGQVASSSSALSSNTILFYV